MNNSILINVIMTLGCLTALLYSVKTLKYNDDPPQWFMSACQYSALATVATGAWFIVKNVWGL